MKVAIPDYDEIPITSTVGGSFYVMGEAKGTVSRVEWIVIEPAGPSALDPLLRLTSPAVRFHRHRRRCATREPASRRTSMVNAVCTL